MRSALEGTLAGRDVSPARDLDLSAALGELADRAATAVWMHHIEERPVTEVADRLGCSVAATKLLLLRSRRRLAERVGGVTGRWMSERLWTPDAIIDHLDGTTADSHVDAVVDDLEGRGGRWELRVADGAYTLFRDDGTRLDSGSCHLRGCALELVPARVPGRVLLRVAVDGDRLNLGLVTTTTPPTRGVPDDVWVRLFWASGPFSYAGRSRPVM